MCVPLHSHAVPILGRGPCECRAAHAQRYLHLCFTLPSALGCCKVIVEAVPEDLDIKKKLFREITAALDHMSRAHHHPLSTWRESSKRATLLCSNTMTLSIADISADLQEEYRSRLIGLRFLHPVSTACALGQRSERHFATRAQKVARADNEMFF